jgi:methylated-DNA-[protein]-cysteine S-methyltransferase
VTKVDVIPTPVGPCTVWVRGGRVFRSRLGSACGASRSRLPRVRRWLKAWFQGGDPRVPLDLSSATPFQRRVYEAVRRIPPGRTLTYGQVARAAGRPGAARAVGNAMARNPICLFIP